MSAVYDYEPTARNDPMVSLVDNYLQAAVPGIAPGKTVLLKALPFCKCLVESTTHPTYIIWESVACARLASRIVDQAGGERGVCMEEQDDRDALPIRSETHGELRRAKRGMAVTRNPSFRNPMSA